MLTNQQKRAAIDRNKARVIDLLKWSLDDYHEHLWAAGVKYLELYFGNDDKAITKINPRKEFWNWFINLWDARNQAFIEEWDGLEDETSVHDMRVLYSDLHNPAVLACEIKPPAIVYGDSFTKTELTNEKD